jgi:hypothetical protein
VTWIIENREWVFSGIGVLAITALVGLFRKNTNGKQVRQSIKSGNNSINIQGSRGVRVSNGRPEDEK